jgi:release factor glutamine methyltransferase
MNLSSTNVGTILRKAWIHLKARSDSPALDAQVLMAHILQKPRAWVMAHPETPLDQFTEQIFESAIRRLEQGEPLAYILGKREFYGLEFIVSPHVLIPRPETEHVIDLALEWLNDNPECRRAADIGTGSGCIAITLASRIPDLQIWAVDISASALEVARSNALLHTVSERITFLEGDLFTPLSDTFDLICANLPYGPSANVPSTGEPHFAIDGGADGLDLIRRMLDQAPSFLAPHGLLLMEIESRQGNAVTTLARYHFPQAQVRCHPDLAGWDRVIEVRL